MDNKISVYIKINDKNEIVDIDSDIFIKDLSAWIKIDEGISGDKYAHAKNYYLDNPIMNDNGEFNYKYVDKTIVKL